MTTNPNPTTMANANVAIATVNPYAKKTSTSTGTINSTSTSTTSPTKDKFSAPKPGCYNFGLAASTEAGRGSALVLYNKVAKKMGKPQYEELCYENLNGDQAMDLLRHLCFVLSKNPIPMNATDDLLPVNPNSNAHLSIATVKQYMGRIRMCFQEKTPELSVWGGFANKASPKWWTDCIIQMEKAWKQNKQNLWDMDPDMMFGQYNVLPIYSHNFPDADPDDLHNKSCWYGNDVVDKGGAALGQIPVDLEYMMKVMLFAETLDKANDHAMRVVALKHGVGRCTETKYLDFNRMHFDMRFQCIVTNWLSAKTLYESSTPIVYSLDFSIQCFFWNLAFYFGLCQGLRRTFQDEENKTTNHMFPMDQQISASALTKKMTAILRKTLPDGFPEHLVNCISTRSIRSGMINELSQNLNLSALDVCARSHHATGYNMDKYNDPNLFIRGMRGAHVLAGNPKVDEVVKLPCPSILGQKNKASFDRMLTLYLEECGVPAFERGGHLYPLTAYLLTVMIHRHNDAKDLLGPLNARVVYLENLAKRAQITSTDPDATHPSAVLSDWSYDISEVQRQEVNAKAYLPSPHDHYKQLQYTSELLLDVQRQLSQSQREYRTFAEEVQSVMLDGFQTIRKRLDGTQNHLLHENSRLSETCDRLERKCSILLTPTRVNSNNNKKKRSSSSPIESPPTKAARLDSSSCSVALFSGNGNTVSGCNFNVASNSTGTKAAADRITADTITEVVMEEEVVSKKKNNPPPLHLLSHAQAKVSENATVGLYDYLQAIHKGRFVHSLVGNLRADAKGVPDCCKRVKYMHVNVLELLGFVTTKEERKKLMGKFPKEISKDWVAFYHGIVKKMTDKMWNFRGEFDIEKALIKAKKTKGMNFKATVCGVSNQLKKYKKKLEEVNGGNDLLMEYEEYEALRRQASKKMEGVGGEGHKKINKHFTVTGRGGKFKRNANNQP